MVSGDHADATSLPTEILTSISVAYVDGLASLAG
jgi:hypothetical protein